MEKIKEPDYKSQFFGVKILKLSNRGWKTHERVIALDDSEVKYYKKAPKDFLEADDENHLATLGPPKLRAKLIRIYNLGTLDAQDKKSKILKRPEAEACFFKMSFYRDGLLKGAEEDSDEGGSGEEDEDVSRGKSLSRSGTGKPNGTGKAPASLTWYFKCESPG